MDPVISQFSGLYSTALFLRNPEQIHVSYQSHFLGPYFKLQILILPPRFMACALHALAINQ